MERKSFLLRIDPKLWAELEKWAQDEMSQNYGFQKTHCQQGQGRPTRLFGRLRIAWQPNDSTSYSKADEENNR